MSMGGGVTPTGQQKEQPLNQQKYLRAPGVKTPESLHQINHLEEEKAQTGE